VSPEELEAGRLEAARMETVSDRLEAVRGIIRAKALSEQKARRLKKEALKRSALSKLTLAECKALGLDK
jgi:hypothetical protein